MDPGARLGHYEILEPLGAGGMGEVYRARDTKLGRDVAVKMLPVELATDPELLARLRREARVLAGLDHPNINTIFALDDAEGSYFLVLQLIDGVGLDARLEAGRLDVHEALEIARQVAAGLQAAHEAGVVHRDLKPANIMVRDDGRVLVLDFGIAKSLPSRDGRPDIREDPTALTKLTRTGAYLGTVPYMSPEQVRGQTLDERVDIWAFGCLLYELFTGQRPFARPTAGDTLAAVLDRDPDWHALPAAVPRPIRRLVRRCLRKDRDDRLHSIADARIELQEALQELEEPLSTPDRELVDSAPGAAGPRASTASRPWLAGLALVGGIAIGVVATLQMGPASRLAGPAEPTRLSAAADLSRHIDRSFALSRDGRTLAYVGAGERLFVRPLGEFDSRPLEGTRGARTPFFSPDGEWIGYWAEGAIHRVSRDGGPTQRIASASAILGASWTEDGRIVFAEFVSPLRIVSAHGGEARDLVEASVGTTNSRPHVLPGDAGVLFETSNQVALASLETGEWEVVLDDGRSPVYSPSGHLVFKRRDDTVWAVRFDLDTLQPTGEPFPAQPQPVRGFAVADNGTFVFARLRAGEDQQLVWVDRQGAAEVLPFDPAPYLSPRLSPDSNQIAVGIRQEIWVLDLARGTRTRLVGDGIVSRWPVWTHGGSRITFTSSLIESEPLNLFWRALGSPAPPERLIPYAGIAIPISWSESTQELAFYRMDGPSGFIKALLPDGVQKDLVVTHYDDRSPVFSPDGRRLAYVSNASGRDEIYIVPYPEMEPQLLVSRNGGIEPVWARDGTELYYRDDTGLVVVPLPPGSRLEAGMPELLFPHGSFLFSPVGRGNANYDVGPDGRFLMVRPADDDANLGLWVVLGWAQEIQRQAAGR